MEIKPDPGPNRIGDPVRDYWRAHRPDAPGPDRRETRDYNAGRIVITPPGKRDFPSRHDRRRHEAQTMATARRDNRRHYQAALREWHKPLPTSVLSDPTFVLPPKPVYVRPVLEASNFRQVIEEMKRFDPFISKDASDIYRQHVRQVRNKRKALRKAGQL